MSITKVTISLTGDQQKQIQEATGKSVTEMNLTFADKQQLSESELDQVQGGAVNAYLYVDGVQGPSTSRTNHIDILSFSWGSNNPLK